VVQVRAVVQLRAVVQVRAVAQVRVGMAEHIEVGACYRLVRRASSIRCSSWSAQYFAASIVFHHAGRSTLSV
jgi:hypothetical protein